MSYKVKSLLYFACFLVAITVYYNMDHKIQIESLEKEVALADTDMNNIVTDNIIESDEKK